MKQKHQLLVLFLKNTLYQRIYIRRRFRHCDIYEEVFRG